MSASLKTIAGAWPPSSIVTRFMCWPASEARCLPTGVEPVKVTLRITGWAMRYSEISAGWPKTRPIDVAGHAGVEEGAHELHAARRRVLGAFEDHRAAGAERARDLADRLVDREVPRREGGDRPDRLADDDLHHALGAARDDAAIGAPALLGEPVDGVGAAEHLHLGLGQGLPLLERHDPGDRLGALAQEVCRLAHDLVAVIDRGRLPGLEAALCRLERRIEILARRDRMRPDRLGGRRVEHRERPAPRGAAPGAADVKLYVRVHGDLVFS